MTLYFEYFVTELDRDVLTIFDGGSVDDSVIANLSGSDISLQGPYMSTYQQMYLRFKTDPDVNYGGFSAQYSTMTLGQLCAALSRSINCFPDEYSLHNHRHDARLCITADHRYSQRHTTWVFRISVRLEKSSENDGRFPQKSTARGRTSFSI